MSIPELYKIYPGTVERITTFGCFVRMLGFSKDGLVHISQLANSRVEKCEDVVSVGDKLFVKVLSLGEDPENPKISLSIKTVNQTTGADLDPTNLVAAADDKGKREGKSFDRPKIELGAVYNTKCTKCGATGHMAKMCMAGGNKYELVEDEDDDAPPEKSAIEREFERHARKLEKKAKKEKKKREKSAEADRFDMNAYMAAGEAAIGGKDKKSKHKHKKKKDKEKSKKKRKSRGDDSSDDSDEGRPDKHARI